MIYHVLNEENLIYEDGYGISVTGDGETFLGWARRPYFKLFTGSKQPNSADKIIRIYFDSPKYVFPLHTTVSRALFLSTSDKKDLMKILTRDKIWEKMNATMVKKRKPYEEQVLNEGYPIKDYYELPDYRDLVDKDIAEYLGKNWKKIPASEREKYGY